MIIRLLVVEVFDIFTIIYKDFHKVTCEQSDIWIQFVIENFRISKIACIMIFKPLEKQTQSDYLGGIWDCVS